MALQHIIDVLVTISLVHLTGEAKWCIVGDIRQTATNPKNGTHVSNASTTVIQNDEIVSATVTGTVTIEYRKSGFDSDPNNYDSDDPYYRYRITIAPSNRAPFYDFANTKWGARRVAKRLIEKFLSMQTPQSETVRVVETMTF